MNLPINTFMQKSFTALVSISESCMQTEPVWWHSLEKSSNLSNFLLEQFFSSALPIFHMPWYRQHRRLFKIALIAVSLLNIGMVVYFRLDGPIIMQGSQLLTKIEWSTKSIQKEIESLVADAGSRDAFWLVDSKLEHVDVDVLVEKIRAEDNRFFYDPRVTLAVYLNELADHEDEIPTLPFHWVDWVDATSLNHRNSAVAQRQMSCRTLRRRIRGRPSMLRFCIDKDRISDEDVKKMGYARREQLPDAIIFSHCGHMYLSYNEWRKFMAKSYTVTNFAKPFRVVILNKEGGTYDFDVDQNRSVEQRLGYNGMVERYIASTGKSADGVNADNKNEDSVLKKLLKRDSGSEDSSKNGETAEKMPLPPLDSPLGGTEQQTSGEDAQSNTAEEEHEKPERVFHVNHLVAHRKLLSQRKPRSMSYQEANTNMVLQAINAAKNESNSVVLQESQFEYMQEHVSEQLKEFEERKNLSFVEENYRYGLQESDKYDGKSEPEYFKESTLDEREPDNVDNDPGWHYDWRFFNDALFLRKKGWSKEERVTRTNILLERLIRNWSRFAHDKGIVSWIMHGPLLSWYWNGLLFPYDVDIDIQMPARDLIEFSKRYNQTLVVEDPSEGYGRFLIDVSTFVHNRDISHTGNHIDARFIDVDSGIYIDITGLGKSTAQLPEEYNEKHILTKELASDAVFNDRRKHFYTLPQLLPLRYSMINGVPFYVPHRIENRLQFEYEGGITNHYYKDWFYVPQLRLWVSRAKLKAVFGSENTDWTTQPDQDIARALGKMRTTEIVKLVKDDEVLLEYQNTRAFTKWHEHEKKFLFDGSGKDLLLEDQSDSFLANYFTFTSQVRIGPPMKKCLFEYEEFARQEAKERSQAKLAAAQPE